MVTRALLPSQAPTRRASSSCGSATRPRCWCCGSRPIRPAPTPTIRRVLQSHRPPRPRAPAARGGVATRVLMGALRLAGVDRAARRPRLGAVRREGGRAAGARTGRLQGEYRPPRRPRVPEAAADVGGGRVRRGWCRDARTTSPCRRSRSPRCRRPPRRSTAPYRCARATSPWTRATCARPPSASRGCRPRTTGFIILQIHYRLQLRRIRIGTAVPTGLQFYQCYQIRWLSDLFL